MSRGFRNEHRVEGQSHRLQAWVLCSFQAQPWTFVFQSPLVVSPVPLCSLTLHPWLSELTLCPSSFCSQCLENSWDIFVGCKGLPSWPCKGKSVAGWHVCVSLWETQKLIRVMSGVGEWESSSWWGTEPAPSRRLDSQRLRRTSDRRGNCLEQPVRSRGGSAGGGESQSTWCVGQTKQCILTDFPHWSASCFDHINAACQKWSPRENPPLGPVGRKRK